MQLIFERLKEGQTLNAIYGKKGTTRVGGGVTDPESLQHFLRQYPKIAQRIQKLADENRRALRRRVGMAMRRIAAPGLMRNDGADAYEAIMQAGARLWEGERGDVMSLMFVAVAEGRLQPKDAVARMPEFLREHRRQFGGKFGPLSLDQPLFDDSSMTLGDTVTAGLWHPDAQWH